MTMTLQHKHQIRRNLATKICEHLDQHHRIEPGLRQSLEQNLTVSHLDRVMAFKTDPWYYEFRAALSRLENGSYGLCTLCRSSISLERLSLRPTTRVCDSCIVQHQLSAFVP